MEIGKGDIVENKLNGRIGYVSSVFNELILVADPSRRSLQIWEHAYDLAVLHKFADIPIVSPPPTAGIEETNR